MTYGDYPISAGCEAVEPYVHSKLRLRQTFTRESPLQPHTLHGFSEAILQL